MQDYYDAFSQQMHLPYQDFRRASYARILKMKALKFENGDFVRDENGRLEYVTGINAFQQRLKHRVTMWADEWFLAAEDSIDWLTIFQKPYSQKLIITEIARVVRQDADVNQILEISIKTDSNRLSQISFTVFSEKYGRTGVLL